MLCNIIKNILQATFPLNIKEYNSLCSCEVAINETHTIFTISKGFCYQTIITNITRKSGLLRTKDISALL